MCFNPWQSKTVGSCKLYINCIIINCNIRDCSFCAKNCEMSWSRPFVEPCQVHKPSSHVAMPRHVLSRPQSLSSADPRPSSVDVSRLKAGLSTSNSWEPISTWRPAAMRSYAQLCAAQLELSRAACDSVAVQMSRMSHRMSHRMSYDVLRLVKLRHWM